MNEKMLSFQISFECRCKVSFVPTTQIAFMFFFPYISGSPDDNHHIHSLADNCSASRELTEVMRVMF